ncbi:MAG: c-type cytochrome [Planctomycetes bacterium]|nr:c-type cytochrome [Planctomycetota bacterium]MCP4771277.1 c-type cytochrome [Planctomycetota bacterium]MCP4861996.1 c-type cytochrome [Planctomycetota bacterium]
MSLPRSDSISLAVVAVSTLVALYFTLTGSFAGASAEPIYSFEQAEQSELFDLMTDEFGGFLTPTMSGSWAMENLQVGRKVYEQQCIHCHGTDGHAETYTANLLTPAPRDFGLGVVKFTSTPVGLPATRNDLLRTIKEGVASTSMSRFEGSIKEQDLQDVADYAMYLLIRGAVWTNATDRLGAGGLSPAQAFAAAMEDQRQQFDLALASSTRPKIPSVADSARGREMYFDNDLGCLVCHQVDASGGPVNGLDLWGQPMVARDLTKGELRGGDSPADVYLRIRNGVKGTPMPAMAAELTPEQIWDLVAFVRSVQEDN